MKIKSIVFRGSSLSPFVTMNPYKNPIQCWSCKSVAKLKVCSGCGVAKYCSRACQASHWSLHTSECKSFVEHHVVGMSKAEFLHVEGTIFTQELIQQAIDTYGTEFEGVIIPMVNGPDENEELYSFLVCKDNTSLILGTVKESVPMIPYMVHVDQEEPGMWDVTLLRIMQ